MIIKAMTINSYARMPTYASAGAACFDLYACERVQLHPGSTRSVATGLALEIPPGFAIKVHGRSGMWFGHSIRLGNCTGIIDSDYRGELRV